MKIIQTRELERLLPMLQGTNDMRNLAIKILMEKETIRMSVATIILYKCTLLLLLVTAGVYIGYEYTLGWYLLPVILAFIMIIIYVIITTAIQVKVRAQYNDDLKTLIEE